MHANGIRATVVERVRQIRPLGVGINLQPHAVRELIALGLAAAGIATAEHVYVDPHGNRILAEPRGILGGHRRP